MPVRLFNHKEKRRKKLFIDNLLRYELFCLILLFLCVCVCIPSLYCSFSFHSVCKVCRDKLFNLFRLCDLSQDERRKTKQKKNDLIQRSQSFSKRCLSFQSKCNVYRWHNRNYYTHKQQNGCSNDTLTLQFSNAISNTNIQSIWIGYKTYNKHHSISTLRK